MGKNDIWVAKTDAVITLHGVAHPIQRGITRVRDGHRLLDAGRRDELFEPLTVHYDVEQASAAPGEKRGAARATSPAAAAEKPPEKAPEPPKATSDTAKDAGK